MVRNYQKSKAKKAREYARANSQPITNMFARTAAAAAPNAAEENEVMENMDESNNNANAADDDNDGGGGGGGGGRDDGGDGNGDDDKDDEGRWPPHVEKWVKKVKDEIDEAVKMTGRGDERRPMGPFPDKYKGRVSPSDDPVSFFHGEAITADHFALPDMVVWYPEGQYPSHICPRGRSPCKWHNEYTCCVSKGWMDHGRRAYAMGRVFLVLGRRYECSVRRDEGKKCRFRNIDIEVINNSHDYIRLQWKKIGFDFSRRAGISNRDLELSRRCLVQGLSVSGFANVMGQASKHRHLMISGQYRSYTETLIPSLDQSPQEVIRMRRKGFHEFESAEYSQTEASTSYLLSRLVLLMESSNKYKERRMQMMDGVHLSGDHSFKVVKCCSTRGKPFTAVYCLLNEFSQIVAWWLTTGTGMDELKAPLQKLRERYNILGYDGPLSIATDRCCQERPFWNAVFGPMNDDAAENAHLLPDDTDEIEVVHPPHNARCAYDADVAGALVGEISSYIVNEPRERQVIVVDGEWTIGNRKMDLLIIGLLNGQVFLFHLAAICRRGAQFPLALKTLLEDPEVSKVGNRIFHDVNKLVGWEVDLSPTIELGHLANDRCVSPSKSPSLPYLIHKLYPGVIIEGKEILSGPSVRTSNWNGWPLSSEQTQYANADGYAPGVVYLRLMQIMDPKVEGKINQCDVAVGMRVVLYLQGLKSLVAEGVIRGIENNKKKVTVEIDLAQAECKGAIVHTVNDDGSIEEEGKSIHSLCSNIGEGESTIVNICWGLSYCRRRRDPVTPVQMNTLTKQVLSGNNDGEEEEIRVQNYDGDDETNNGFDSSSTSDGETDNRTTLARNLRRRLYQFRKQRVKNDIEHIFLRFQRVLSKEHGAYYSFITSLRDALFILNNDDLEECFEVLREKRGKSDEEIAKMMAYDFRWFLRRVRRLVPSPPDLEKRYMAVYNAHKDIVCQKSGKKLFGKREAIAQHQSALKHIRRNCISDIPLITYYTPLGRDKFGLMRWRCHRGTSQNEGLHQKLRQLIRGFSNSPRFLCAVISEYLLQWNQNIDVKVRGLPSKYYGLYDGVLLEDEIEKLAKNVDNPPHPEWIPTSSVQDTGETFGVIITDPLPTPMQIDSSADSDADDAVLTMLADEGAGELSDDEADGVADHVMTMPNMPASSQWMANLTGKIRPFEKLNGHDEWEYFEQHYVDFHGSGGGADNHSNINWSAFAEAWNKMVDGLGRSKPTITYKSASHLQHAYKSMRRRRLQDSTLRPHAPTLRDLQERHTNAATRTQYLPQFPTPIPATTAHPFVDAAMNIDQAQAPTPTEQAPNYDADLEQEDIPASPKRKKNRGHRCRQCGNPYANENWRHLHVVPTASGGSNMNLRNQGGIGTKVWQHCKVPEEQYVNGFPRLTGRMPKPTQKKRRSN